jgi:hypothetical protein
MTARILRADLVPGGAKVEKPQNAHRQDRDAPEVSPTATFSPQSTPRHSIVPTVRAIGLQAYEVSDGDCFFGAVNVEFNNYLIGML